MVARVGKCEALVREVLGSVVVRELVGRMVGRVLEG